jgi:predicted GTPase
MSLRARRGVVDPIQKRQKIIDEIKIDYTAAGKYQVTRAEQKNVMLIGRTRTGKSTIKSLLVDPTVVPDDLTLESGTRDPLFESFYIRGNELVLNIIDTPGLFEHSTKEITIRDNATILRTIEICVNREVTKFHAVCFCIAITAGINQEDIELLKLLVDFLGQEISSNLCLIVTRCESRTDIQRAKLKSELMEDSYF